MKLDSKTMRSAEAGRLDTVSLDLVFSGWSFAVLALSTYLSRNECPRGGGPWASAPCSTEPPNALLPQAPFGGHPSSPHYCPELRKKKKKEKKNTSPFPGVKENHHSSSLAPLVACVVSLRDCPSWLTKGGSLGACRNKDGIGQRKCEKKKKKKRKAKNKRKICSWECKLLLQTSQLLSSICRPVHSILTSQPTHP